MEDIDYLLGHGNKSMTSRYAHISMDVLRKAIAHLDKKPQPAENSTDTKTGTTAVLQFKSA